MTEKIERVIPVVIEKGDAIVAISGLFANVGVCGIDLTGAGTLGILFYFGIIVFGVSIGYGLWTFKSWGWLITVLFSVCCIVLVIPALLNYHAALVSMILLSYIFQPEVREKYITKL